MMKNKMRKEWIKSLTPQKAWDFFYGDEVKRFISDLCLY